MKDLLKEFIDKNRAAFDNQTPDASVWNKIQSRLPGMKQVSLWNSLVLWRVAAVLFLGLSITLFFVNQEGAAQKNMARQLQGEFQDVESFYVDEIAKKVALIDHFDGTFENDQFSQDFEKLDAMYQVLRDELKIHPSEKVRDALILNILVRIDLLNQQIKKLEELKGEKSKADASV